MTRPKRRHFSITEGTVLVCIDGMWRAAKMRLEGSASARVVVLALEGGREVRVYLD